MSNITSQNVAILESILAELTYNSDSIPVVNIAAINHEIENCLVASGMLNGMIDRLKEKLVIKPNGDLTKTIDFIR